MKKLTRNIFLFLLMAVLFVCMPETAQAEEDKIVVEINEETFPDPIFRNHILTGSYYIYDENNVETEVVYDANKDGKLSESEIANVKQMHVPLKNIQDLTGIEYFTSLIELNCQMNLLTSLDVSKNTELLYLNCYKNSLSGTLDLSTNTKLVGVCCQHNADLSEVIVSNSPEIVQLDISSTKVTSIDLSNNPKLRTLFCFNTPLTELDLSHNPALEILSCYKMNITSLDLSNNPLLTEVDCSLNPLESLDLSNNTNLIKANLMMTKIQGIDVSNLENLKNLQILDGSFVWANVGSNENLTVVTSDGAADLSVPANGFDITKQFPGIDASKITIVSGGELNGNIISGYKEGTPVVYTYDCGTAKGEAVVLTVTLNLDVEEETPVNPDQNEPGDNDDKNNDNSNPGTKEDNASSDKQEETTTPKTGDAANVMALFAVFVAVAAAIGFTGKRRLLG